MPAIWPAFITSVGGFLDDPSEGKTHTDTAEKISSEYHKAVKTAQVTLHATLVSVQPPYIPIKMAIEKCLNDIKESEGEPQLFHFTDWADGVAYGVDHRRTPVVCPISSSQCRPQSSR